MPAEPVLILGASARAAAFSAARAGFEPYWIDLFGDQDLSERFHGLVVTAADYPRGIINLARRLPSMPFLITGAMENHLSVLQFLAGDRRLLGNDAVTCGAVRDPDALHAVLTGAGLASPAVAVATPPADGTWLCKPRRSGGGLGIRACVSGMAAGDGEYLQEYIQGRNLSAVFIGDGRSAVLAGVTRQLVGKAAFHAARFAYCGSIGPLVLTTAEERQWHEIGAALAGGFGLRGLFGVDAVQRDGTIFPVEVNPRYTASVEVVEAGTGLTLVDYHVRACAGELIEPVRRRDGVQGKSILFAPVQFSVQADLLTLPMPCEMDSVTLADVPAPGTLIEAGHPVVTLLVNGRDQLECMHLLTEAAAPVLEKVTGEV